MKIGIIGAGNIGATVAGLFTRAGHEVAISNSRGPESLKDLVAELGEHAHAATVEDAARFGDVVLLAIPWRTPEGLPRAETLKDKIVIDAMNPYTADGQPFNLGDETTSSEETLKRLPGARLVKAFNTIYFKHLQEQGRTDVPTDERRAIFLAGDDEEAKQVVGRLIEEIGFAPVDTGSLKNGGRRQQPDSDIYNRDITGREAQKLLVG
ncbi:MAG TPA: NADPH-dependent F420 reductase [Pyrinomonadaceae bacterium]